jgi:hypothetical protein
VLKKRWIVLLIAMAHFVLTFVFLQLALALTGFETFAGIRGRIGHAMFLLAFAMMYPAAGLRDLHVPTLVDLPLWEGSLGDYFGDLPDLPLMFLNSVLWAIVVYELWSRYRAGRLQRVIPDRD